MNNKVWGLIYIGRIVIQLVEIPNMKIKMHKFDQMKKKKKKTLNGNPLYLSSICGVTLQFWNTKYENKNAAFLLPVNSKKLHKVAFPLLCY